MNSGFRIAQTCLYDKPTIQLKKNYASRVDEQETIYYRTSMFSLKFFNKIISKALAIYNFKNYHKS